MPIFASLETLLSVGLGHKAIDEALSVGF